MKRKLDEKYGIEGEFYVYHNDPLYENPLPFAFEGTSVLPPEMEFSENELVLGNVPLGDAKLIEITITNSGDGPGQINRVIIPERYERIMVLENIPLVIEEEEVMTLRWSPLVERELEGSVLVYHNDPDLDNPLELSLEGSAYVPPSLTIQRAVRWGMVDVGETDIKQFTISNSGDGVGIITDLIAVDLEAEIDVLENVPFEVGLDTEERITISWTPRDEEGLIGVLEIYHNDPELDNPFEVGLYGGIYEGVEEELPDIPGEYFLAQNYPNPFNPETTIRFGLKAAGNVRVTIVDILGRQVTEIVNSRLNSGYHQVQFDGSNLSAGLYFYTLEVNGFRDVKKMILVK